jgi:hypothetical protein
MKKILFIIPLLGICSSLLAQAPTVKNVQAEQIAGTKDVNIQADFTGKLVGGSGAHVHAEVWFKENEADTSWTKVPSIYGETSPGTWERKNLYGWDPATATEQFYPTIDLGFIDDASVSITLKWKAGDDAPNINTSSAKIRIVAFYVKMENDGFTAKPMSEQTSGWNGEGDFGSSATDSDGDGFSDADEVAAGSDPYNAASTPTLL